MNPRDAATLLREAIPAGRGTWADLGAGEGTFTRALAESLGPGSRIVAVDRDAGALKRLARAAPAWPAGVTTINGDFTRPLDLPALDGLLLANALHYVRDAGAVLARLAGHVRRGGRVVIVEYDRRRANPWVPHPIPIATLPDVCAVAGLAAPRITAKRASAFGGDLYVAVADRV